MPEVHEVILPATDAHPKVRLVIPGSGEDGGNLFVRLPHKREDAWYFTAEELTKLRWVLTQDGGS